MEITKQQFQDSLFYPAAGTDLQPLIRFSHLTDLFIYPTVSELYPTFESYVEVIDRKLERLNDYAPGALRRVGDVRPISRGDIEAVSPSGIEVFSERDREDYEKAFARLRDSGDCWGVSMHFERKIGDLVRKLTLYVLHGEGLATYAAMSHNGQCPCKIMVTINSGVMEEPEGFLEKLMLRHPYVPVFWVRGKWTLPDPNLPGDDREQRLPEHRSFAREKGRWNRKIQSYPFWNARMGEASKPNEESGHELGLCTVIAFSDKDLALNNEVIIRGNHTVTLLNARIGEEDIQNFDAIFLPHSAAHVFSDDIRLENREQLQFYEGLDAGDFGGMPERTLPLALEYIKRTSLERGWDNILMCPIGFEDEGVYLNDFVKQGGDPLQITIKFADEWDFADLRG